MEGRGRHRRLSPFVQPRSLPRAPRSVNVTTPIRVLGQTDRAGRSSPLETSGDINPVAHEVTVALLNDVAEMNADPEFDPLFGRQAGVTLDHAGLHLERALSHQPFLLIVTCPAARIELSKFNGLASQQNASREPFLARCDSAGLTVFTGYFSITRKPMWTSDQARHL